VLLGWALEALWQSFGFSDGSWGFGNVLTNWAGQLYQGVTSK